MAFPLLENSNHVVVSVSIDFPSNSLGVAPFHRIACDDSLVDWDGLRDHFERSATPIELSEWVQVGIDIYIDHGQKFVTF